MNGYVKLHHQEKKGLLKKLKGKLGCYVPAYSILSEQKVNTQRW
jgi:hypothetical protein